jgi:hypothetical protein
MLHNEPIQAGDRVRASCPLVNLPEGSTGVVQRVFHTVDLYDVLFEERHLLYVLHRRHLALMPPERIHEVAH